MAKIKTVEKKILHTTFTLPPLDPDDDNAKNRKASIDVYAHENGRHVRLVVNGFGLGGHRAHFRWDRSGDPGHGPYDEALNIEWDGDNYEQVLEFTPTAAIVVVDGNDDEIRVTAKEN